MVFLLLGAGWLFAIVLAVGLGRAAARGDRELIAARVMHGAPAVEPELEPGERRRLRAA